MLKLNIEKGHKLEYAAGIRHTHACAWIIKPNVHEAPWLANHDGNLENIGNIEFNNMPVADNTEMQINGTMPIHLADIEGREYK